jgi:hypothetical protein
MVVVVQTTFTRGWINIIIIGNVFTPIKNVNSLIVYITGKLLTIFMRSYIDEIILTLG